MLSSLCFQEDSCSKQLFKRWPSRPPCPAVQPSPLRAQGRASAPRKQRTSRSQATLPTPASFPFSIRKWDANGNTSGFAGDFGVGAWSLLGKVTTRSGSSVLDGVTFTWDFVQTTGTTGTWTLEADQNVTLDLVFAMHASNRSGAFLFDDQSVFAETPGHVVDQLGEQWAAKSRTSPTSPCSRATLRSPRSGAGDLCAVRRRPGVRRLGLAPPPAPALIAESANRRETGPPRRALSISQCAVAISAFAGAGIA